MIYELMGQRRIDFDHSIVGYEQLQYFRVEEMDAQTPFCLLQSEEDPNVGFIIVSPFDMYKEYEIDLSEELIAKLNVNEPEDVIVLSIVTVRRPFIQSTMNLLAPLVVNVKSGEGRQFIMNGNQYSVQAPLFPEQNGGE